MEVEQVQHGKDPAEKPSLLQLICSVFAAAIGVQSRANQERDFNSRALLRYITAGLLFTAVFILSVTVVVKTVLSTA